MTPAECVAHWLADSVEILIDPRGNGRRSATATRRTRSSSASSRSRTTRRNSNGNGVNGPCWSRDADNHQGYSTGPLAATVDDAPNAPGVQVATDATWVGTNETTIDHAYAGGGYTIEVKIPMADLPAAVDPDRMGLNITPYDNDDNTAGTGSTTLRHIDMSTRLAWSTFGSVQSDPYRWGHATLPGYTPPAGRPTTPDDAERVAARTSTASKSPQTIAQSARDGVPISGRVPAPANDRITAAKARLEAVVGRARPDGQRRRDGAGVPVDGRHGLHPGVDDELRPGDGPGAGLRPVGLLGGRRRHVPPWSPDMSGRVVAEREDVAVGNGVTHITIPLDAGARDALAEDGRVLVSFETPKDEVQALDVPLDGPAGPPAQGETPGGGTTGGGTPARRRPPVAARPAARPRRTSAAATRSSAPPRPTA